MTRPEYLTQFERHLRVGEPKRSELVAELTTHLDECDDVSALGDPIRLAAKYDRTHIGFFGSWQRLLLAPVIIGTTLFTIDVSRNVLIARIFFEKFNLNDVLNQFVFNFEVLACLIMAVILGRAASRFHGRSSAFGWLSLITLMTCYGSVLWMIRGESPLQAIFAASLMTLGLMAVGMVAALMAVSVRAVTPSQRRLQLTLELSIAVLAGFLSLMVSGMMTFMNLHEFNFVPILLAEGTVAWYFIRRIRRYRTKV